MYINIVLRLSKKINTNLIQLIYANYNYNNPTIIIAPVHVSSCIILLYTKVKSLSKIWCQLILYAILYFMLLDNPNITITIYFSNGRLCIKIRGCETVDNLFTNNIVSTL